MRGTMLIYRPLQPRPTEREIERALTPDDLKAGIAGDDLAEVPGFKSVEQDGEMIDCIAFCDGEAKEKRLAVNAAATIAWDQALRRHGLPGLARPNGMPADYLAGPVIVLFGDAEFMAALRL